MKYQRNHYNVKSSSSRSLNPVVPVLVGITLIAGILIYLVISSFGGFVNDISSLETKLEESWDKNEYKQVVEYAELILNDNPVNIAALYYRGNANFVLGYNEIDIDSKIDYMDEAILSLRKALVLYPESIRHKIEYVLAKAYYIKGDFYASLSVQYMNQAIAGQFVLSDSYEYLGLAYAMLERYDEAIKAFLAAKETQDSEVLDLTLARTYFLNAEYENSKEIIQHFLMKSDNTKNVINANILLGDIYFAQEFFKEALAVYQDIIKQNSSIDLLYYKEGLCYEALGDQVKARASWRKAVNLNPANQDALNKLYA